MFFALRGGGGGTFGVVLDVTLKALPQISFPAYVPLFTSICHQKLNRDDVEQHHSVVQWHYSEPAGLLAVHDLEFLVLCEAR